MARYKRRARRTKRKRTKKRGRSRMRTSVTLFPGNRMTVPDQLHVTFYCNTAFRSPAGVGPAGVAAYYNISGNYLVNPFVAPGVGPTFIPFTAVVGTPGMAGVVLPQWNTNAPMYFAALMGIYRFYHVKSSSIKIDMDLISGDDEGELVIRPQNTVQNNSTSMDNAQESRFAKSTRIGFYQTGNKRSNYVSNFISTKKLQGYAIGAKELTLEGGLVGTLGTPPATPWNWQVMYQTRNAAATTGAMTSRIQLVYKTILFSPSSHEA